MRCWNAKLRNQLACHKMANCPEYIHVKDEIYGKMWLYKLNRLKYYIFWKNEEFISQTKVVFEENLKGGGSFWMLAWPSTHGWINEEFKIDQSNHQFVYSTNNLKCTGQEAILSVFKICWWWGIAKFQIYWGGVHQN